MRDSLLTQKECAFTAGSGAVVHSAKNISGPWVQQSRDVNCQAEAPMCGAPGFPKEDRPLSITIHAQGLGLSKIGDEFIWQVCAETDSLTVNLLTHYGKIEFTKTGSGRMSGCIHIYKHPFPRRRGSAGCPPLATTSPAARSAKPAVRQRVF